MHFEELWEACESLHKDANQDSAAALIDELSLKLNIYKVIDLKTEIPEEERTKIKSRTLGEILLTLTNISLIDNINVFDSLNSAYKYRSIQYFSKKY